MVLHNFLSFVAPSISLFAKQTITPTVLSSIHTSLSDRWFRCLSISLLPSLYSMKRQNCQDKETECEQIKIKNLNVLKIRVNARYVTRMTYVQLKTPDIRPLQLIWWLTDARVMDKSEDPTLCLEGWWWEPSLLPGVLLETYCVHLYWPGDPASSSPFWAREKSGNEIL